MGFLRKQCKDCVTVKIDCLVVYRTSGKAYDLRKRERMAMTMS